MAFLTAGTVLYYFLGRNAWYFQYRQEGAELSKAKELARRDGQQIFPAAGLVQSLLISARVWKTWALLAVYFTTFGGFIALTAWLPTYWTTFLGVSTVTAGTLTAAYSITASLVRIYGGKFADKFGGENTAILALLLTLCGAGILVFSNSIPLSITGELLMAVGMGAGNGAVFKLVPQAVPQAVGGASGWVGGLGAFGGFAIPPMLGAFVRSMGDAGYASGFVVFIVFGLISLGLSFTLKRVRIAKSETRTA